MLDGVGRIYLDVARFRIHSGGNVYYFYIYGMDFLETGRGGAALVDWCES